jgi:CarD family transcriptional regulator
MFEVNDDVIYGTSGVCVVAEITASPFDKKDARTYYKLLSAEKPAGGFIYTPVDNDRIAMRRLLTKADANALLDTLQSLPSLEIPIEKQRKETYKQALAGGDPALWVGILRSVRERGLRMEAMKKQLPDLDRDFYDRAEKFLVSELAMVLDRPKDELLAEIRAKI